MLKLSKKTAIMTTVLVKKNAFIQIDAILCQLLFFVIAVLLPLTLTFSSSFSKMESSLNSLRLVII